MYKKLLFALFFIIFTQPSFSHKHEDVVTSESVAKVAKNSKVLLTTNMGEILLELYPNEAPLTVDNFLTYVEKKYYDGLIFHRVIRNFMIQTGGFNEDISRMNPFGGNIPNESHNGLKNIKYSIAMARTSDPDSAKAQFFINVVDNSSLDASTGKAGYAVFGRVIRGMNIADKISRLPTQRAAGMRDVPTATIKIIKARIIKDK